jgi:hypothetical protein
MRRERRILGTSNERVHWGWGGARATGPEARCGRGGHSTRGRKRLSEGKGKGGELKANEVRARTRADMAAQALRSLFPRLQGL